MVSVKKLFSAAPLATRLRHAAAGTALALLAACQTTGPAVGPATPAADSNVNRYLMSAARGAEADGNDQSAAAHYRALANGQPGDKAVALALARSLRRSDATEEAVAALRAALAASGPDAALLVELGKLQIAAGHAEEALTPLEQAARLAPEAVDPPHALAIANDRLGRHAAATAQYDKALKRDPGNVALLNNYAMSNALAGRLDRARDLLTQAALLPGAPAQVRANLALLERIDGVPASPRPVAP